MILNIDWLTTFCLILHQFKINILIWIKLRTRQELGYRPL